MVLDNALWIYLSCVKHRVTARSRFPFSQPDAPNLLHRPGPPSALAALFAAPGPSKSQTPTFFHPPKPNPFGTPQTTPPTSCSKDKQACSSEAVATKALGMRKLSSCKCRIIYGQGHESPLKGKPASWTNLLNRLGKLRW